VYGVGVDGNPQMSVSVLDADQDAVDLLNKYLTMTFF